MLPFELFQKIGKNLDFLSVNNMQRAWDLHEQIDPRIVHEENGNLICMICLHSKLDQIMNQVLKINDPNSAEYQGMR